MPISTGSRIGPYEVTAPLGEGGMGVVFRARDSRLQRDVALKLLPENFANDADRLARFKREAQLLASLNHPNIAQIYGLEQVDGAVCIVMELVEGETLADRLKNGALRSDEAVEVSRQIADALAAAHERGIVHRDLKPANIKLTPGGTAKVLDFGLAKALGSPGSDSAMSMGATGSLAGAIIGTPGYMSPEQARGKDVDARTDIWAFGCVLYEMLTGRQPFEGETVTDVMARIVTSPPDLELLPKDTPSSLRRLLSSTLNKNAAQRLQHIGDTRLFFDGSFNPASLENETVAARPSSAGKLLMAALVVAAAAAALFAALYFRRQSPEPSALMRFELSFPNLTGQPILSPDGSSIIYGGQIADDRRGLFIRPIGSDIPRQLAGTDGVNGAWWSADSKRLAYISEGKVRVLDLATGSARIIGNLEGVRYAGSHVWNKAGDILVSSTKENVILRIRESGGEVTKATMLDASRNEVIHAMPVFLPSGDHFLYVAAGGPPDQSGIFMKSLDPDQPPAHVLPLEVNNFNGMAYVPGFLLVQNQGNLTAYPMNADGKVHGEPLVVAEGVDGTFSASDSGLLLYHKAAPVAQEELVWYDRTGQVVGRVGAAGNYGNLDISPQGDQVAVDLIANNNRDIWVIDLQRGVPSRITFDPASDWTASWSPDGKRLAFGSNGRDNTSVTRIYEKSSTGNGTEAVLPTDFDAVPVNWSPRNDFIVFSRLRSGGTSTYDTWLLPLSGDRMPKPFLETPFDKFHARVSPDGRHIAFSTNESGRYQIVVHTFPDPGGGKWTISADGGVEPKWSRNGRELFYLAFDGKLMSVPISGPSFSAGRPSVLFQTPLTVNRAQPSRDRRYDIAPDGRFLINTPNASGPFLPFTVVVNWASALKN